MIEIGLNLAFVLKHAITASCFLIVATYIYRILILSIENKIELPNISLPQISIPSSNTVERVTRKLKSKLTPSAETPIA